MKRLLIGLSVFALAVMLTSCSQSASITVQLGSASGSVVRGNEVNVPVSVSNASGAVTLSVSGLPSGVTATFAASSLSGGATTTTLDVQVSAAAVDGNATLTVDAVDGSAADSASYALSVTSLSVNGTVVDVLGGAVTGATVAIQGRNTTTDANGQFTIPGVAIPYRLFVRQSVGPSTAVHVFEGLTSAMPTVVPYASVVGGSLVPMSATVSGSFSSAVAAGYVARVCVQSTSAWMSGCSTYAAGTTSFTVSPAWPAGANVPVTVRAIEVAVDGSGFATGYGRYGMATGTVTNGSTPTMNITWGSAPAAATVSPNVNVPAGFVVNDIFGAADTGSSNAFPLFHAANGSGLSSPYSYVVPEIGSAGHTLVVAARPATGSASTTTWMNELSAGSGPTIDLPTPPTQTAPADGATGIGAGSTLSLSSASGAVTFVLSGPAQSIAVTTSSASITIPDLSWVSLSMVPGGSYTWQAIVTPGVTTPEEAAAHWVYDYILSVTAAQSGGTYTSPASGSFMTTQTRGFTAP